MCLILVPVFTQMCLILIPVFTQVRPGLTPLPPSPLHTLHAYRQPPEASCEANALITQFLPLKPTVMIPSYIYFFI